MSQRDRAPRPDRPAEAARPHHHRPTHCPARWSRRGCSPPSPRPDFDALSLAGAADAEGKLLKTILLVDGDDFAREALGQLLEADGFRVDRAADHGEAVARLDGRLPDLILVDLLTPGLGGWRAIRRLRREPALRDVPVIVVSALDAPLTYGRPAGIVACYEKPVTAEALRAAVRRQLGG